MARVNIVDRMQNRASPSFGIGSDDAARHPVMAVDYKPSSMLCPYIADEGIYDVTLK